MGSRGHSHEPADGILTIDDLNSAVSQAVLQETRLRILAILASAEARRRGGYSLQEMGQMLDCSPQNAHHHLRILGEVGVARVFRTEATQRIPRQFWVSDVHTVRLRPDGLGSLQVDAATDNGKLRAVARAIKEWAESHGGADAEAGALQIAAFLTDLGPEASRALLGSLREHLCED